MKEIITSCNVGTAKLIIDRAENTSAKLCPRCRVSLILGQAIQSEKENLKRAFNYFSKGNLIQCLKCPQCGYSEIV